MDRPLDELSPVTELIDAAREMLEAGKLSEAAEVVHRLISMESPPPTEQGIALIRALLRVALDLADACCDRGETLIREDQFEAGAVAMALADQLQADIALLHERLGDVHLQLFEFDDAIAAYRSSASLQPDSGAARRKLDDAIEKQRQPEQVVAACRAHVQRTAGSAAARLQLANALREYRRLDEAVEEYERVIALEPGSAAVHNNLAIALANCGRVEESQTVLRRAAEVAPSSLTIQSNHLYGMYFHPADDPDAILRAHREFDRRFMQPLTRAALAHSNDRSPDRELRIGYVSPDFREHCQSFFTVPLLTNHERSGFRIFCYADVSRPDAVTDRLRGCVDIWRDVSGLSDERLAQAIRADRIDILVDLTMHMSNGRPALFARKPAPVQVAWLAYPGTTGLSAIDFRFSDPYLDPPGMSEEHYSETTVRLPDTFWCYDPLSPAEPTTPLPARQNGYVTFGCLNNFCKVSDRTLLMWRQVLREVGNSRMILLAPPGRSRERVLSNLEIESSRIEFVDYLPRPQYLKLYERIDICLDTFPYNGHTTSLDALWMGVPVISLRGRTAVSRAGWSQASNLRLARLVGDTPQAFAHAAISLAANPDELAELRRTLRDRMLLSPLMDAPRFCRNVAAAYRRIWHRASA